MHDLRTTIAQLAQSFAESVLAAIAMTSIQDLVAVSGGGTHPAEPRRSRRAAPAGRRQIAPAPAAVRHEAGRLARRSPEDIAKTLDLIVKFLKTRPTGLRSEEIRKAFGLDVRELPRILQQGRATKKLKTRGRKRATTYSAA
jgi:hypothetical protein